MMKHRYDHQCSCCDCTEKEIRIAGMIAWEAQRPWREVHTDYLMGSGGFHLRNPRPAGK